MLQQEQIDRNYDVLQRKLADLLPAHSGHFVLLKDVELIDVFINPGEAYRAGLSRYGDGYFSVQPVTDKPIELGHMSFALR